MEYGIVVDSTADLPEEIVQKYNFSIVHFPVQFQGKTYLDKLNLSAREFFTFLRSKVQIPKTSAPPPGSYFDAFHTLLQEKKKILALTISSKLSAAYQSALLAKNLLAEEAIEVIDTGSISMGTGLVAIKAAQLATLNATREKFEEIKDIIPTVQILALFPDISFAALGGRVSPAVAKVVNALNIEPIIRIKRGIIELVSRASNYKGATKKIVAKIKDTLGERLCRLAVMHADAPEEAQSLKEELESIPHEEEIIISEVGPVLGTHSGPGAVFVAFYPI